MQYCYCSLSLHNCPFCERRKVPKLKWDTFNLDCFNTSMDLCGRSYLNSRSRNFSFDSNGNFVYHEMSAEKPYFSKANYGPYCTCDTCSLRKAREMEHRLLPGQVPPYVAWPSNVQPRVPAVNHHMSVYGREAYRVCAASHVTELTRRYRGAGSTRGVHRVPSSHPYAMRINQPTSPYSPNPPTDYQLLPSPPPTPPLRRHVQASSISSTPPPSTVQASPLCHSKHTRPGGVAFDHSDMPKIIAVHSIVQVQGSQYSDSAKQPVMSLASPSVNSTVQPGNCPPIQSIHSSSVRGSTSYNSLDSIEHMLSFKDLAAPRLKALTDSGGSKPSCSGSQKENVVEKQDSNPVKADGEERERSGVQCQENTDVKAQNEVKTGTNEGSMDQTEMNSIESDDMQSNETEGNAAHKIVYFTGAWFPEMIEQHTAKPRKGRDVHSKDGGNSRENAQTEEVLKSQRLSTTRERIRDAESKDEGSCGEGAKNGQNPKSQSLHTKSHGGQWKPLTKSMMITTLVMKIRELQVEIKEGRCEDKKATMRKITLMHNTAKDMHKDLKEEKAATDIRKRLFVIGNSWESSRPNGEECNGQEKEEGGKEMRDSNIVTKEAYPEDCEVDLEMNEEVKGTSLLKDEHEATVKNTNLSSLMTPRTTSSPPLPPVKLSIFEIILQERGYSPKPNSLGDDAESECNPINVSPKSHENQLKGSRRLNLQEASERSVGTSPPPLKEPVDCADIDRFCTRNSEHAKEEGAVPLWERELENALPKRLFKTLYKRMRNCTEQEAMSGANESITSDQGEACDVSNGCLDITEFKPPKKRRLLEVNIIDDSEDDESNTANAACSASDAFHKKDMLLESSAYCKICDDNEGMDTTSPAVNPPVAMEDITTGPTDHKESTCKRSPLLNELFVRVQDIGQYCHDVATSYRVCSTYGNDLVPERSLQLRESRILQLHRKQEKLLEDVQRIKTKKCGSLVRDV